MPWGEEAFNTSCTPVLIKLKLSFIFKNYKYIIQDDVDLHFVSEQILQKFRKIKKNSKSKFCKVRGCYTNSNRSFN